MRKAFDILPPRKHLGSTPAEVQTTPEAIEVPPVQATDLGIGPIPYAAEPGKSLAVPFFGVLKSGVIYLTVGLVSFGLFSALFWGYNQYQDRQRAALEQPADIAGTASPTQASLRLLNGSGSSDRLAALQDVLTSKGYEVRAAGTAAQLAERTTIYFKTSAEATALKLAQDIAQFAPSLEKNDNLAGVDDLVILLGAQPPLETP